MKISIKAFLAFILLTLMPVVSQAQNNDLDLENTCPQRTFSTRTNQRERSGMYVMSSKTAM